MQTDLTPEQIQPKAEGDSQRLLQEFHHHLAKTNAEHAFISLVIVYQNQKAEQLNNWGYIMVEPAIIELAAFLMYPHFGNTDKRDPAAIEMLIDLLPKLQLNRTASFIDGQTNNINQDLCALLLWLRLYHQGVRGSAYPDQTKELIVNIQARFEEWFTGQVGIGPRRAVQLIDAICEQIQNNTEATVNAVKNEFGIVKEPTIDLAKSLSIKNSEDAKKKWQFFNTLSLAIADLAPVQQNQLDWLSQPPTITEWRSLIKLIGLTKSECSKINQPSELKSRPLFVLPDERLFHFSISCVFDELFLAFDRLARSNPGFYDRKYRKQQVKWMEARVADYLKSIFPPESVFTSLLYPDPDTDQSVG